MIDHEFGSSSLTLWSYFSISVLFYFIIQKQNIHINRLWSEVLESFVFSDRNVRLVWTTGRIRETLLRVNEA